MEQITTEMMEHICDNLCKHPSRPDITQEELDAICDECKMGEYVCSILNTHNELVKKAEKVDKLYLEKCKEVNKLTAELKTKG